MESRKGKKACIYINIYNGGVYYIHIIYIYALDGDVDGVAEGEEGVGRERHARQLRHVLRVVRRRQRRRHLPGRIAINPSKNCASRKNGRQNLPARAHASPPPPPPPLPLSLSLFSLSVRAGRDAHLLDCGQRHRPNTLVATLDCLDCDPSPAPPRTGRPTRRLLSQRGDDVARGLPTFRFGSIERSSLSLSLSLSPSLSVSLRPHLLELGGPLGALDVGHVPLDVAHPRVDPRLPRAGAW